jgi:N utilization substance protein B
MALPQAKLREIIFQLLYSRDVDRSAESCSIALLMKELHVTRSGVYLALSKAAELQSHQDEIDATITKAVQGYTFARIQSVERCILRLATYELTVEKTTPPKVVITEAMRLGRKFATPESANFINAVLDAIYKTTLGSPLTFEAIETTVQEMEAQELLIEKNKHLISETEEKAD